MKKLIVIVMVLCGMVLFVPGPGAVFAAEFDINHGLGITHRSHENKYKVAYEIDLGIKVNPGIWAGPFVFMNNITYLGYGIMGNFDYPTKRRNLITWKIGLGIMQERGTFFSGFEF